MENNRKPIVLKTFRLKTFPVLDSVFMSWALSLPPSEEGKNILLVLQRSCDGSWTHHILTLWGTIRLCPQKAPSHHCLRLDQWAHQSQSTMFVMIWFPDHGWPAAMDCEQEKRYSAEHKKEQDGTAAWNTNQSWNLDVIKWHPSATKTTYIYIYILYMEQTTKYVGYIH